MGGCDRDLKIEAIGGGVGDLKIDDYVVRGGLKMEAAAMGGGDRGLKMMKAVVASEGGDTLKRNEGMINVVGLLARASWKEAVASKAADDRDLKRKEPLRPEEGGILRLKKEMKASWDHWFQTCRKLRKATPEEEAQALGEATQEKAQAPGAGKKRRKVVKVKLREDYVEHMRACPFSICADFSDEQIARFTPYFREIYAAGRFLETKNREYWNALIAQKDEFGYAEDENEVTDDEEEEVEVKN